MGEIRIKSGNLYPIQIGEDMWNNLNDATHSNNNGELIVVMGTVDNSGVYSPSGSIIRTVHKDLSTYSWSVEIKADSPASLVIGFEGDGVKYFNITSEYQKLTFNNQSFISDKAFVIYNRTGVMRTVYLRNFMLNEGSAALPYQPYFLNRPAHQVTNGEWIDIPTHHYINNRWQGELTSQSPLKFRATGQSLLDWRIDGKTSGNLFDVITFDQYAIHSRCTSTTDGHNLTITATESGDCFLNPTVNVGTAIYNDTRRNTLIPCKPNTTYTLYRENAERIYTYWASVDSSYTVTKSSAVSGPLATFTTDADAKYIYLRLGNAGTLPLDTPVTLQNIRLMEGTYTTSTIPPYEPYGGVGDWDETAQKYRIPVTVNGATTTLYTDHQLMDGDSIDFSTDQTQIPIATGNNTLTVDTAVKPKSVFVKFEG